MTLEDNTVRSFEGDADDVRGFVQSYQEVLGDVAMRIAKQRVPDELFED